jgi:hypothetical protein
LAGGDLSIDAGGGGQGALVAEGEVGVGFGVFGLGEAEGFGGEFDGAELFTEEAVADGGDGQFGDVHGVSAR